MAVEQDTLLRLLLADRARMIAYIRSIVRDEHLAEDVFQDVSIIILNKKDKLKSTSEFQSWLRGIARLEALNALRKANRHVPTLDAQTLELMECSWQRHERESTSELAKALDACINNLTANARNVLRLRYAEGLSGQRLAEVLDRKVNTVYMTVSRIHRALHDCITHRLGRKATLDE